MNDKAEGNAAKDQAKDSQITHLPFGMRIESSLARMIVTLLFFLIILFIFLTPLFGPFGIWPEFGFQGGGMLSENKTTGSPMEAQAAALPSGAVIAFADPPTGAAWVDCSSLGDGWEEFRAADGRFILGASDARPEWYTGRDGGESEVVLTIDQMPIHSHLYRPLRRDDRAPENEPHFAAGNFGVDESEGRTSDEGGGAEINNMPPYIALTYCKKV